MFVFRGRARGVCPLVLPVRASCDRSRSIFSGRKAFSWRHLPPLYFSARRCPKTSLHFLPLRKNTQLLRTTGQAHVTDEIVVRRLASASIPYSAWQPLSTLPAAANAARNLYTINRLIHLLSCFCVHSKHVDTTILQESRAPRCARLSGTREGWRLLWSGGRQVQEHFSTSRLVLSRLPHSVLHFHPR